MPSIFGNLFAPPTPGSPLANLAAGFDENPNAILGTAFGLLAHRQNAVANPLGQVAQNFMTGSQIDARTKEANRIRALEEQDKNQTVQWIVDKGLGSSYDEVMKWPEVVRQQVIADALKGPEKGPEPTDDMQEFDFARKNGFTGTFTDFLNLGRSASSDSPYFGQPIYGTAPDGTPIVGLPGKDGSFRQLDLGGATPISRDPLDVARRRVQGEAQGQAAASIPAAEIGAQETVAKIDALLKHPGRETATGLSGTFYPQNYIPGTNATNFRARLESLKGEAFLQARQALKGGGQITNMESDRAEAAYARLQTAQSDEEFVVALEDFRNAVDTGVRKLQASAGQKPTYRSPGALGSNADPFGLR